MVQDAAGKKSNNLLLDTTDLGISQYSLLGQTPPHSAPDSPAIHARDASSAAPSEPAPEEEEEEGARTVTADVCLQNEPELNADTKSDPSAPQSSEQSTVLLSPVIVVTQQFDESQTEEASCVEETQEVDTPSAAAESSNSAAPDDSEADVSHEVGTADDTPANPESNNAIPDLPNVSVSMPSSPSSPQSTDVPADFFL